MRLCIFPENSKRFPAPSFSSLLSATRAANALIRSTVERVIEVFNKFHLPSAAFSIHLLLLLSLFNLDMLSRLWSSHRTCFLLCRRVPSWIGARSFFFASSQLGLMGLLLALTFPVGCDSIKIKGPCFCYLLAGFFLFWSEICRCFPHFYRVALLIHPCLDWQTRRAVEEPSFTIDT